MDLLKAKIGLIKMPKGLLELKIEFWSLEKVEKVFGNFEH